MSNNDCLQLIDSLNLPAQDRDQLSFSPSKINKITLWVETLPVTNVSECSVILYKALPEVSSLKTSPDQRLEILELLLPIVNQCTQTLARDFLNQPVILPEKIMKMAMIGQALQRYLNEGYMVCVEQWLNSSKKMPVSSVALALYRAINGIGQLLLRSYQLYSPKLPGFWRKIHNLYQLAISLEVAKLPIADTYLKHLKQSSCEQAYLKVLMLGASGTNQLRQTDLESLFDTLELWCHHISLDSIHTKGADHLFWVTIDSDEGPFYRQRHTGSAEPSTLGLNFEKLIQRIDLNDKDTPLNPVLLKQVIDHWQVNAKRREDRQSVNNVVDICPGLINLHNTLLDGESFDDFIKSRGNNDYDDWDNAPSQISRPPPKDMVSTAITSDISKNGVCLKWSKNIPPQIKVGEAIGVRLSGSTRWRLGIVRWIQRHDDQSYAGINIISQSIEPSAASTTFSDGTNSPYFRVLQLESDSMITPSVPFDTGQNIRIRQYGKQHRARLEEQTLSSGAVSVFKYRRVRTIEHVTRSK